MKKLLMALALLPLMAAAETWYDPSTGYTWLYSEKLGDTPGMWGGFICELNNEEIEIGPGERHQNKFAVSPAPTGAVVIPATINGFSVVSVGCAAFEDAALTAITIPSTVRYIGGWAISGCKKLKSVVVPESVVWIGEKAFDGCTALETVSLSEGLEYIDWNAFDGCVKLASITLPNSLQAIEEDAFIDCRALKLIYVSRAHADRLVGLLGKSGFDVAQVSVRYVGEEPAVKSYTLIPGEAVSVDTGLIGYTAKGLPSGLKYNKTTGMITGAATKPTAIAIRVDPLPDWAVGTFEGAVRQIDYDADGNVVFDGEDLHNWYDIVATVSVDTKGKISGKLTFPDKKTLAVKLNVLTAVEPGICIAEGDVMVKRQRYAVRAVFGAGSFQFADGVVTMGRCDLSIILQGQPTTCFRTDADCPLVQTFWSRKELKGRALQMGLTAKSGFDVENATGEDVEFSGVVKVSDKGVAKLTCTVNGTKSTASGTLLPVGPDVADGFAAYVSIKISRTSFRAVKLLFVPTAEGWMARAVRWQ